MTKKRSLREQAAQLRKVLQQPTIVPAKMESWTLAEEQLRTAIDRQRSQILLEEEILSYAKKGYRVTARSESSVQLVRPKTMSTFGSILWIVFTLGMGIPLLIVVYLLKREQGMYIRVTAMGSVDRVRTGPLFSLAGWLFIFLATMMSIVIAQRLIGMLMG